MSFEGKIYQDLTSDDDSHSYRQTFGQERVGFSFKHNQMVILGLSLLNGALLITATVIGIYCAKANDLQVSDLAVTPFLLEMNFLRNHTGIIKAKVEAQKALVKEQAEQIQLKLEVRQKKILMDNLEKRLQVLQAEKTSLQSNRSALEKNCDRCPTGWILSKTSCYYFSQEDVASRKNWLESRADCISKGADLLMINNLEEQQMVSTNFPRLESSRSSWWLNGFWIGLHGVKNYGTWQWLNNKTEESTMYWRSGQPSNTGTQSGNCVAFLYYADTMRTWYNGNCHEHQLNWICEMEASGN